MGKDQNPYKVAYEREKQARLKAEEILEAKSRELFLKNQKLQESYETLQKQQAIMLKNEKLATLGTLSAGITHEINNPLAFVKSNIESLYKYHTSYARLIEFIKDQVKLLPADARELFQQTLKEEDIDYIQEDLPDLMADTKDGLCRVRDIVMNLRSFARTQYTDRCKANLIEGIESTLQLLHGELKNSVELSLNLQPTPSIICNPNELNQVFLNLIINAKHATEGVKKPMISIASASNEDTITITIADNGCGMNEEALTKIFVPFYTTKPVGKGTGLGLAIAYGIVQDHKGEIKVASKEGQGTSFNICLPIN
ncbi:sensor histidine kinase [Neptuniibacter sp.]|uniref:sensor histidine kinase n=1 Tax=Neptuniibacter sp. TaxID=1962643 RepID=UPI003B59ECEE